MERATVETPWSRPLLDVLIRAGLVAFLALACFEVFAPFLNLMLWAVILAVTLYPLQVKLRSWLGGSWFGRKEGRIATLIVLLAVAVLLVPIYLMALSLADSAEQAIDVMKGGKLHVPPPSDAVAGWPVIGPRLHAFWTQAATDLSALASRFAPQIRHGSLVALQKIAGFGLGLLLFFAALAIAGIIMAYASAGTRAAERICTRLFGEERGPGIVHLCTATIRAVAQGVVGIAFIQMLLIGLGFVLMGVPGAGLLALLVLVLGIMQVPATLVTVPVIAYVLTTDGFTATTIALSVFVFLAGLVDNVLKPLLLGRGVEVPMPVVLIGALGGMIVMGLVGLFVGPVILAVGYQLFWQWVDTPPSAAVEAPVATEGP